MPATNTSEREATSTAFIAAVAGAIAFLAPHLYFLLARGLATFFNPPSSLWPTMLSLAVAAAAVTGLTRAPWLRMAGWCEIGAVIGVAAYLGFRSARGEDLNLWPIALVLGAGFAAVPIACGTAVGVVLARLRRSLALLSVVVGSVGLGLLEHLRAKALPQAPKSAYWGVIALAPGPRARASATHWCGFSSAIPNIPEIRDSITVLSSANFDRDRARDLKGDPWTLTLVRLAGSDSVELRANDGTHLVLAGRMTSPDEAFGAWQCSDSLSGQPDSLVVIEGEWVLRRGGWPGSELNWPVIPHPPSTPDPGKSPSGRGRLHPSQ